MKRYLVFFGSHYYPSGGMGDFLEDFDDLAEAINFLNNKHQEDSFSVWGNIFDCEQRKEVYYF